MYSKNLDSAAEKLAWAEEEIQEFQRQLRRFADSKPYRQLIDIDPQTGEKVIKIKLTRPMPSQINRVIANTVGALRACLDHAGFAVAVANGSPGKWAAFPFSRSAAEMREAARSRSKEIHPDIFAVMASFHPYRGGNDALWALNELCNSDKHRTAFAAMTGTGGVNYERVTGSGGMRIGRSGWDRVKNELEILRFAPGATIEYKVNTSLYVAFSEIEVLENQPVEPYLTGMAKEISTILIEINNEAKRLGLFQT